MSQFDPDLFLGTETDASNATKVEPIPECDLPGVIESVSSRSFMNKAGDKEFFVIEVKWALDAPHIAEELGRDKLVSSQTIFLDINEQGNLEMGKGKNVGLGRLREAVNQNADGRAWAPTMLVGAGPALCKIAHRFNGEDAFDEVKSVTALA